MNILIILFALILWLASAAIPSYLIISSIGDTFVWQWFVSLFVFLLVIVKAIDSIVKSVIFKNKEIADASAYAESIKYSIVGINCHKCRNLNSVPIEVNSTDNKFECDHCSAQNKVLIAFRAIHPSANYTTFDIDQEILDGNISAD